MTEKKLWRNRKERKEWGWRLQSEDPGLEVVHSHAAGIDVGNGMHYVAVRPDRDPQPVRRFECFTADLHCLAEWLQRCGVKTVAMQSTGVYWIPIYEILEERGIQVYLVNARHTNIFLTCLFSELRLKRKDFQKVARLAWAQEAPGSNPGAPAIKLPMSQVAHTEVASFLLHGISASFQLGGTLPPRIRATFLQVNPRKIGLTKEELGRQRSPINPDRVPEFRSEST